MTPEEIANRVNLIKALGDPESKHIEEDQLYETVLKAIAAGNVKDPAECAKAALKTKELNFPRWYS